MTSPSPDVPVPAPVRRAITIRDEGFGPPADTELTRRTALKFLSASALLTMGAGCTRKPLRHIVAISDMPEYQRPGIPLYYATTFTDGPWPYGMKVKAVDGRPIKIEGLPGHPLNDGTTTSPMQTSTWSLYDPDRLQAPEREGKKTTWDDVDAAVVAALKNASSVLLVTRSDLGPSERALVGLFLKGVRGGKHVVWEAFHEGPRRETWKAVYGRDGLLVPDLRKASVILSLDCDFLGTDGDFLGNALAFASRRKVEGDAKASRLSRLWVAEGGMTVTGSNADHRIPLRPSAALDLVDAIRASVGGDDGQLDELAKKHGLDRETLAVLAQDLAEHKGEAVVLAGSHLPPQVHASVVLLNEALGAPGHTLLWESAPPMLPVASATELEQALAAGPDVAIFLGTNPLYDAPGNGVRSAFPNAKLTVGHALSRNETLAKTTFALPSAHNLESWNDRAPGAGVESLCQPLIAPLYDGRQGAESLLHWARALRPDEPSLKGASDFHDFVKRRWEADVLGKASGDVATWNDALRRGFVGSLRRSPPPAAKQAEIDRIRGGKAPVAEGTFDVLIQPHHGVHDGRFSGVGHLLELPDPVSKVTWDNYLSISPALAEKMGLALGDMVRVRVGEKSVTLPALAQYGNAEGVAVTMLGFGRTAGAGLGNGIGVDVTPLLGAGVTPWLAYGAKIEKTGEAYQLVRTQKERRQHGRPIVLDGTKTEYVANPAFVKDLREIPPLGKLYEDPLEVDYAHGHKWAMAIDLSTCIGCGVCTIACETENNIAYVGKEEVFHKRDMHWMRIDRYEDGDPANPKVSTQPMLCQHCQNAPCENVCPVNASVHGHEGLNEQVYNRCVGTRYCENNCPYKVRRFNFFNYTKWDLKDAIQELRYNPQVTVRTRGVMEKCTFCIQRINAAKFAAGNAGEPVADGSLVTACQQACPTKAIVFGDENDEKSVVRSQRHSPLGYRVLEELNVRPSVTYLARVRNPHPRLAKASGGEEGGR